MITLSISDEDLQRSGLDEKRFKIKLAVMMYEGHLMTLPQAAVFVGISKYEMQHEIGIRGIKIRWEEDYPRSGVNRQAGGLKGFVKYMADDFDAPLEDFKDYM